MDVVMIRRRRRAVLGLVVSTLVATVGLVTSPTSVTAGNPGYREYVALGDSWSAATAFVPIPVTTHVPIDCAQQAYNYPKQVAAALGITNFRDATCGSATTVHMTQPQSLPLGGVNPPQFDRLTATTDLVTLGIGGNDIGLAAAITDCISVLPINIDTRCRDTMNRVVARIPAAEQAIVATIAGIRQRSPNAQIFVVDYLAGVPKKGCWPIVPVTDADMLRFYNAFAALNQMVHRAAATGGAHLVDTYSTSGGHDVCTGPFTRWVEGLIPLSLNGPAIVVPAHPNSAGATAQANYVRNAVSAVAPIATTTTTTTSTSTTTSAVTTTVPATTAPPTTAPPTTAATTTAPPTTEPPTTSPPTTVAPTDPPTTTAAPTTVAPTTSPPTTAPDETTTTTSG